MKKTAPTASKKGTQNAKKLKDMSVDDFMNSFGDSDNDSDSVSDENITNGHANGHSAGSDSDDQESMSEGDEEFEDDDGSDEDEEVDDEGSGEDEELDEEEESGEEEELEDESGEEAASGEDDIDEDDEDEGEDDDASSGGEEGTSDLGFKHKKDLSKLKELDPEFYKYLEANDKKLLQFNVSDSEDSEGEEDGSDDEVHRPSGKLEVNSDESDFEPDDEDESTAVKKAGVVSLKMVEKWRERLQTDKSVQTINEVVQAFHAALLRVAPEEERSACQFKVEGSAVFNAVVQMCVLDLLTAFRRYLGLSAGSLSHANPVKCKRWGKVKTLIRSYAADLLQLSDGIASVNISTVVLKHIHQMTPFIVCFPNITKQFLKKMISLWATGEQTVRVVAFMCILRATSLQQRTLLDQVLRHMYLEYVKNTKFVSPTTMAGINFMRRSLVEMFLLDENVSYHHAFLYIRQLAIHLRNAITLQKKESVQAVYNWQFISSLALWIELLSASSKQALQPLLYPVVQVTTGAIKLIPTTQYYPLRFHCVRLLISLSRNSGTFIPVLPFLLEILNSYDFNKKHTKVTMKPMDFSCILRLSKVQLQENGFKDAVIENIYSLALEYLADNSNSIAFPDLALPTVIQIKDFLKRCKVANYTRKLKQILDKIEENIKFIEKERKTATFKLSDTKAIEQWETAVRVKGAPLGTFFSSWQKMNCVKQTKMKRDAVDVEDTIPRIVRPKKNKASVEGPVELLPSDDSDSDGIGFGEEEEEDVPKKSTSKRVKKSRGMPKSKKLKVSADINHDDGADDVVQDVNLAEW